VDPTIIKEQKHATFQCTWREKTQRIWSFFYNSTHSNKQTEAVSSALKLTRKTAAAAIFTTYVLLCSINPSVCFGVLHVQLERIIVIIAAIPRNGMCVTVCWGTHFYIRAAVKI
jgi:hypothetical protein